MKSHARLLFLALAFASAAYADDVYRSVMPDGRIVYGESAFPGAKSVKKVPSQPPSGVQTVTPGEVARAGAMQPHTGGVTVLPQPRPQDPYQPSVAGSGATYGTGPGPLPRKY